MEQGKPRKTITLFCETLGLVEEVELGINIFRKPEGVGAEIVHCSQFGSGAVTCTQFCKHGQEVKDTHQAEQAVHLAELKKIGPNVIA